MNDQNLSVMMARHILDLSAEELDRRASEYHASVVVLATARVFIGELTAEELANHHGEQFMRPFSELEPRNREAIRVAYVRDQMNGGSEQKEVNAELARVKPLVEAKKAQQS